LADEMAEGVKWLNASANRGFPPAHHALAYLYEVGGAGLQRNLESSRRHRALANSLEQE
jgi:TPR repeat protein